MDGTQTPTMENTMNLATASDATLAHFETRFAAMVATAKAAGVTTGASKTLAAIRAEQHRRTFEALTSTLPKSYADGTPTGA